MNELVTLIVPVYNTEIYIDKCVESLINQTYKNLEIILVDDGSSDNCPQLCDNWAADDSRIKVIHKANGGVSTARNAALNIANGDYITFVDSDDFLEPDSVGTLLDLLIQNDADISVGNFFFDYIDGRETVKLKSKSMVIDKKNILKDYLLDLNIRTEVCNKLYKASLFNNTRFSEGVSYAEDFEINYKLLKQADRVAMTDKCLYHYVQESGNSSTTEYITVSRAESYKIAQKIVEDQELDRELYECALWRYIVRLYALMTRICKYNDKSFSDKYFDVYRQEIVKYKKYIYKGNYTQKQKAATFLLDKFPSIFVFINKTFL